MLYILILYRIAPLFQQLQKNREIQGRFDYLVYIRTNLTSHRLFSVLLRMKNTIGYPFFLWLNHRKSIFSANFIGDFSYIPKIAFCIGMILFPVCKGNGINHDVIMQMIPVKMCTNHNLKPLPEASSGKLHTDFVNGFRRCLLRLERLYEMIPKHAARLMPLFFCPLHFTVGGGC